jgi:KDO2-lipid IV(A) lauroyltransferase
MVPHTSTSFGRSPTTPPQGLPSPPPPEIDGTRQPAEPRWTLHGLNNGAIFRATRRGVAALPRSLSYAIGFAGTWLAWRLMRRTRSAVADNLRPLFPGASQDGLERHALRTLRAYARDVIDFLCALDADEREARGMFEWRAEDSRRLQDLLAEGRGVILITGHYGNWEIGSVLLRRVFDLPLTVVAMAEASEDVNRTRREIRDRLDTETIEVRKSLDTALQIRKRLSDNHIVAMLVDRHLGRDRVAVSLLGRRAWFLRTPALLAHLTGAPLVPCFIERAGRGRFTVQLGEAIRLAREAPREEALRSAAQTFADRLGERIRANPYCWYHFYAYWKAQDDEYAQLD